MKLRQLCLALTLAPTLGGGAGLALAQAQAPAQAPQASGALPPVTATAQANRDPVEKSYRKMVRGLELFERRRALSPQGVLRFKLLPRRATVDLRNVEMDVIGSSVSFPVPIAPDQTFTLQRDAKALAENALVVPNRRTGTMTWRTDIRTPGLPPATRRLGDLRLECEVGMEAGLLSESPSLIGRAINLIADTPAACYRKEALYLFFADQPVFAITLRHGARSEVLAIDKLYAGASDDAGLAQDLPFCDCEVLLDRTYFLPLGDSSWPDDTLVQFDYMKD